MVKRNHSIDDQVVRKSSQNWFDDLGKRGSQIAHVMGVQNRTMDTQSEKLRDSVLKSPPPDKVLRGGGRAKRRSEAAKKLAEETFGIAAPTKVVKEEDARDTKDSSSQQQYAEVPGETDV